MATETEIKIPVTDLAPIRRRLEQEDGRRIHGTQRENNVLFDTSEGALYTAGRALRIRTIEGRCLLTLKGPAVYRGGVKIRDELEVEIADAAVFDAILGELGFAAVVRYQKDRELWRMGEVSVCLDHTPMGDFVEVEGKPEAIDASARAIGLDPAAAVRGSYLRLWSTYRQRHPELELPTDMVFAS
jgi:adenylate cyclase class 2